MMFHIHSMFSLELIALAAGVALLILVKNYKKVTGVWGIIVAKLIIILASLSIICSAYNAIMYWRVGFFKMEKNMLMMKHKMMEKRHQDMTEQK